MLTSIECHLVGIFYVVETNVNISRGAHTAQHAAWQLAAGEAGREAAASVGAVDSEVRGLAV